MNRLIQLLTVVFITLVLVSGAAVAGKKDKTVVGKTPHHEKTFRKEKKQKYFDEESTHGKKDKQVKENRDRDDETDNEAENEHGGKEKHKSEKDGDDENLGGLEKQRVEKSQQVQKELDKGSEQGQATREEKRKKWWKFWESDNE